MTEQTDRLDAIQERAANCLTYNFGLRVADMLAHSDVPFLLDLARKQQAQLNAVRDEIVRAEGLCSVNGIDKDLAAVSVMGLLSALEAKP